MKPDVHLFIAVEGEDTDIGWPDKGKFSRKEIGPLSRLVLNPVQMGVDHWLYAAASLLFCSVANDALEGYKCVCEKYTGEFGTIQLFYSPQFEDGRQFPAYMEMVYGLPGQKVHIEVSYAGQNTYPYWSAILNESSHDGLLGSASDEMIALAVKRFNWRD